MKKKLTCMLLILSLALLPLFGAACAVKKNSAPQSGSEKQTGAVSQTQKDIPKGRYREEMVPLPVTLEKIFDVSLEADRVRLVGENEPGSFYYCESVNSGADWQKKDVPMDWLPEYYRVVSACFAPEGDVIVSAGKMSEPEDVLAGMHAAGIYEYFKISGIGGEAPKAESLSFDLPKPEEDDPEMGYGLSELAVSEGGKLYGILKIKQPGEQEEGIMMSLQLCCFLQEGGKPLWRQEARTDSFALSKDRIYLDGWNGSVQALDAASGKELPDIEIPLEVRLEQADILQKEDRLFYCDKTGIYGADFGLSVRELLVDGKRSRFGNEVDYAVQQLCCVNEKVFLVFVENTALKKELLRYEYDGNLDTEPEQGLFVYSLKENDVIEKLVSDFQSSHPNVYVTYQVGLEQETSQTESDAVNSLNTELLAGKGPDVLFLNNLPWESYQEQGILEDFCGQLDLEQGEFFENLFLPYQKEGKQYAVPISFQIPALVGSGDRTPELKSLEDLSKAIQGTEGMPPLYRSSRSLLRYLTSIYWQRIEKEGSVSQEELKRLLQQAKNMEEAIQAKGEAAMLDFHLDEAADKNADPFVNDLGMSISDIAYGNTAMAMGYLGYFPDFVDMHNLGLHGQALPGQVFRSLLAGINDKSSCRDTAAEFLTFALSEEEQKIFSGQHFQIRDFPVNRKAYEKMIQEPSTEKIEELYGARYETWKGTAISSGFTWPGKEEFDKLEGMIEALSVPAMEDSVVIETVIRHGVECLSGEKEADEAAYEIVRTLDLYFAEKGRKIGR